MKKKIVSCILLFMAIFVFATWQYRHARPERKAKVLMIGGKDASSANLPGAARQLQRNGTRTALLFDEDANHYMMVHHRKKIIDFLNQELELK